MGYLLSLQALDRADDHTFDMQFASTVSAACTSTFSAVC
ncbi:hypothetical protein J2Y46_001065 [Microbacterium sp. BE35]|nr:hypothetical protein [Microbacterium sp. BE35]